MDGNQKELANHLMAHITFMLEDAHSIAVAGQDRHMSPDDMIRHCEQLRQKMHDISTVTRAVQILGQSEDEQVLDDI
ncbi:MAG: hypothetical protein K8F25_10280 [Fimbriimonadaceae bacterium]|nr:hypothetical protein [Alphaproteobacteria bacterium]